MNRARVRSTALTLAIFLAAAAPAAAQEAPPMPINAACPVMGDPVEPGQYTIYEGAVIGFCCEFCIEKFEANPAKYLARMPAWAARAAIRPVQDADGHDHEHDEEGGMAALLGPFHPLAVHFPIALLLAAALAEVLAAAGAVRLAEAPRFALWLGAPAALVTAGLGVLREQSTAFAPALEEIVETHQTLGLLTAGCALAALVLGELRRRPGAAVWLRHAYRTALLAAAGAVAATGHLGGRITFGPDYLPF